MIYPLKQPKWGREGIFLHPLCVTHPSHDNIIDFELHPPEANSSFGLKGVSKNRKWVKIRTPPPQPP